MYMGQDSVPIIGTRYGLYSSGIESRCGQILAPSQTGRGAHSASCSEYWVPFSGLKRPRRGVDHPPLSSAEKSYTSTPPLGLHSLL